MRRSEITVRGVVAVIDIDGETSRVTLLPDDLRIVAQAKTARRLSHYAETLAPRLIDVGSSVVEAKPDAAMVVAELVLDWIDAQMRARHALPADVISLADFKRK
jgi:hypothetical protein